MTHPTFSPDADLAGSDSTRPPSGVANERLHDRGPSVDLTEELSLARFMAEAGRLLGASLDVQATLRQVAALAVPRIADWCAIDLLGPDGSLEQVAVAHRDPNGVALVEELRRAYPPRPDAQTGVAAVIRQGRTMTADVPPAMLRAQATDQRHAALLSELRLHAWMCVPMIAGDRVLGAITLAGADDARAFGPRHIALAEDLAMRAGAAVENARSFRAADRSRRILDTIVEAVFVIEPTDGTVRDLNQGALDLLGLPPDALIGRPLWSWITDLSSADAQRLVEPLVDDRLQTRTVTMTIRPARGPDIPIEALLQRADLPGEPVAIVAIARDIRERIEAERRLQGLAEAEHTRAAELHAVIGAIGAGIIVCAPDGRVTLANPAAERFLTGADQRTYAGLMAGFADPEREAPALGSTGHPVTLRSPRAGDAWVEISTYPVERGAHHAGGRAEMIVVLRDVTQARERDALRETFIGVLSHELRTPVTTIYGGAKILARRETTLDESTRRAIFDDIVVEAERLQRLVEDVVAMNRFGEDGGDLGREPVLLQRVVPVVVRSEEARWPGTTFQTSVPPRLPTVAADSIYVEQVLRNLLSNAAKYGGPDVHVDVVLEADEEEVAVRILDDGPGIDPGTADRLFELFYRSPATSGTSAGAGIGLFVCARLVRAMGGRIWAHARLGGGTEFGFALPIMTDD